MMDCKNALTEAENDFDKAVEIIRKKGQAVAAKRSDRDASEGCVLAKSAGDYAVMIAEVRRNEVTRSWIWQPEAGRAYVAERSTPENRPKIKALLTKHGVNKLTELPEDQYEALKREVAAL